ncbi:zonular occludens toxin domain-containing protein [Roseburia hominis]
MIYLYSGTPGSGKSLHTARVIYYTLKRNMPVIANFAINLTKIPRCRGEFVEKDNESLTPEFLIQYSADYFSGQRAREGALLLVIDECQLMFNAREWNTKGRNKWLSFFTQHRKYGYDVILVAQFDRMIDRQIRSLIEYEQVHRKVSNFGWKGKILSSFCLGKLFVAVKVWYPMKEKVGSEFFIAEKKFYSLYDTFGMFGSVQDGESGAPPGAEADSPEGAEKVS